ncbi:MAG: hypothetical protein HRT61_19250, partial [Ekhidna sp.]|nr:hypothetical protein [Ekhidna sp.]
MVPVAITKSGNTFTLYLNGAQVATGSATSTGVFDRTRVLIGAYSGADSGNNQIDRYFDGSIDELKIWNDARTALEISADVFEKYPSNDTDLEAYYNFDLSSGNLLIDSSPNAFHGTLFGEFGITQSSTSNTVTSEPNAAQGASLSSLSNDETVGSILRNMNDESAAYREDYIVTANTSNTFSVTPDWSTNPVNPGGFAISYNNPVFGASGARAPEIYQVTNASTGGFEANWLSLPAGVTLRFELDDADDFASPIATLDATDPAVGMEFFSQSLTLGQKYYLRAYYLDGTFTSPVSETVEFMVTPGNALEFDGDNDQIDLAASEDFAFGTGDFTIELWANLENETSYMHFFVHGTNQNDFSFKTRPSDQVVYIGGSAGAFNSSAQPGATGLYTPNQWFHVALVRRAGVAEFYVDGTLAYTYSDPDFASYSFVNNKTSIIGWGWNAEYTHGSYDEYRIWDYARTQTEIQDNLYNTLTGNETGLAAYYRFDEGGAGVDNTSIADADAIKDLTGNGNDGDLNSFAKTGANSNWVTSTALQSGTAPAAPTDLIAYRISSTEVQLEWSDNASDNVDYLIEWDDATDFATVVGSQVAGGNATSAVVNLGADQGNFFRVTARNAAGNGVSPTEFGTTADHPGQAMNFTNLTDRITLANPANFGSTTITAEAWVKTTDDSRVLRVVNSTVSGSQRWSLNVNWTAPQQGKAVAAAQWDNSVVVPSTTTVTDGNWHHIAATFNLTTREVDIYVDGVLENTGTGTSGAPKAASNANIGNFNSGFNEAFNGDIDEVRVWSAIKIDFSDRYAPLIGNESNLIAYYPLDEGSGTTVIDRSVNTNNGTNAGATYLKSGAIAPSNLIAQDISTSQINLSWVDNATNETGYVLER